MDSTPKHVVWEARAGNPAQDRFTSRRSLAGSFFRSLVRTVGRYRLGRLGGLVGSQQRRQFGFRIAHDLGFLMFASSRDPAGTAGRQQTPRKSKKVNCNGKTKT